MELDSFLISPKWEILQIISNKPSSPMEIAEKINTSVAYVSQQLKLLDAIGLIKKERTGNVEKGKPRTLFKLSKEIAYLSLLTHGFSEKKLLELTNHHKSLLKIWLFTNTSLHKELEKFYMKLEENLEKVRAIYIDISKPVPVIQIISDSKELKEKIFSFYKKFSGGFKYDFVSESQIKNKEKDFVTLYSSESEIKGGEND